MSSEIEQELHGLVKDTLALMQEETPTKVMPRQKKIEPPSQAPLPTKQSKAAPLPSKELPKIENKDPIFSIIEKHLPHLKLKSGPPKEPEKVIIVSFQQEDLPFIKKLAGAIQAHLRPVAIVDGEKLERENRWESWFSTQSIALILTQKNLPPFLEQKKQILLAPISTYEKNTEQKKELWNQLCQRLPKSS